MLDSKPFEHIIIVDIPYEGQVSKSVTNFHASDIIIKDNKFIFSLYRRLEGSKRFYTEHFCINNGTDGTFNTSKVIYGTYNMTEWGNNSVMLQSDYEASCYNMDGDVIYTTLALSENQSKNLIALNVQDEAILANCNRKVFPNDDTGRFTFRRINLITSQRKWAVRLDLGIPDNAKLNKESNLMSKNGLQCIYDFNLYDGTKLKKTALIDIETGEYTVK